MKKVFAILAIMVVLIAGCTSTNSAEEMIGIRGDITSIYIDNEGSTINVEIQSDDPDSVITGATNKIRIGGTSTSVNLKITSPTTGETKKAVIKNSVSSFTTGLTFTQI